MKPFYAIAVIFLGILCGCQYLSQHPDTVKKVEADAIQIVDDIIQGPSGVIGS